MPLSGRYRAVVFDMDGLLLDSEVLWDRAEGELFRRHGDTWTFEDKLNVMGTSFAVTALYYAQRLGRPVEQGMGLVDEMRELMKEELRRGVELQPGARELMRGLRDVGGIGVGLASNSSRDIVDIALDAAGLTGAFDAIVTSDDVVHAKPAPDIYLLACERLGVAPSDALALEDTSSGIAAAKAAGLTCIAVPQFAETDVSSADRVVPSLEELLVAGAGPWAKSPQARRYADGMCRSIKTLREGATSAPDDEITAAALQYVRKVSGYRKPSSANEMAFEEAVAEVAAASRRLLDAVTATHPEARRAS